MNLIQENQREGQSSLFVGPVLFVLAVWFLVGSKNPEIAMEQTPDISKNEISPAPLRTMLGHPPMVKIGGFKRTCQECHRMFESRPESYKKLNQHQHVVLKHGINDRCFNCHDLKNRDLLRLHGTTTVTFAESVQLCAKCHGPTYRDWTKGIHGKTLGAWATESKVQRRLKCVECHNPHQPAFQTFAPLPGPHTLRMGKPHDHKVDSESPLLRWLKPTESKKGGSHE